MAKIRLIHSNVVEAEARAAVLSRSGHEVDCFAASPQALKVLKERPPDVIVIDLSRAAALGRDLGVLLRKRLATRGVPLVFAGGEPAKVKRVRDLLPDATYTTWARVRGSVTRAIRDNPAEPVVPASTLAAYAGVPLAKKLGIKPDAMVTLVGAPDGFEGRIANLPRGVVFRRGARGRCDLMLWFARSRKEVERRVVRLGELAGGDGLWIVWPKRASGVKSDLTQAVVREIGLASGLVDYKVCSIDDTWSGLKFTRREGGGG